MRSLLLLSLLIPVLSVPPAFGGPSEHLNWGAALHSGPAACPSGSVVINVVQKVVNDIDSGTAGNYWAVDDFVRQIQVVETTPGTFCASVKYQGSFTTVAGPSPGASYTSGTVGDGVVGTFEGGYVSTHFPGSLKSGVRTKGSIGTFDYGCDPATGNCPNYQDWRDLFFTSTTGFDLAWWGWVYHAGNNGSWTNSADGNSGDITGN